MTQTDTTVAAQHHLDSRNFLQVKEPKELDWPGTHDVSSSREEYSSKGKKKSITEKGLERTKRKNFLKEKGILE